MEENDEQLASANTLGQFSFAPATHTTVVTTTTTTTTKFPPFMMPAPKRLRDLDPKLYPLASTPTPESLRNISFEVEGKTTVFREFEDSTFALEQSERPQKYPAVEDQLTQGLGVAYLPTSRQASPTSVTRHGSRISQRPNPSAPSSASGPRRNSGSLHASTRGNGLGKSGVVDSRIRPSQVRSVNRLQNLPGAAPTTPETDSQYYNERLSNSRVKLNVGHPQHDLKNSVPRRSFEQQETPQSQESRQVGQEMPGSEHSQEFLTPSLPRLPTFNNPSMPSSSAVPTPPIQEDEHSHAPRAFLRRGISSVPSRLSTVENSISGQDGSLPSPSLSPVTAAQNLHSVDFDADESDAERGSYFDPGSIDTFHLADTPSRSLRSPVPEADSFDRMSEHMDDSSYNPKVQDFSALIECFERLPDQLKGYMMHQLLRRCPKQTLHVVADVVNPALKCDFLGMLPNELSQHIVKYLDVRSMCRASQVSKKWRQTINNAEKSWKKLFDDDGFKLPEGELQRAVAEGWGWQDPYGPDGWERDIGTSNALRSDTEGSSSSNILAKYVSQSQAGDGESLASRRPKRKAASKLSNKNKKRKAHSASAAEENRMVDWSNLLESAKGPFNAGLAASMAVPDPREGLASLRSLHLYKSLYRRHYLMRKSWMEDVKPRHVAFRAHDRHVVTCLQFDTDKILTGSDDTNINVYDTKTGALRTRLQGHEGGVWALQYDGNVLVSGSTDRSVRVWDIEKGRQMQVFHGHTSTVRCLQILKPSKIGETEKGTPIMMPKQPLIITGSRDSNLRVWKLPQPGDREYFQAGPAADDSECPYFVRILSGHAHSVRAIAAHADTLVSGSYDCTVRVWKISTGETIHRLTGHTQKVYSVVLDHERNRCISGSMDNLVKIWSLDAGSPLYTLDGHSSLVGLLDLKFDRLVSAAADSTLRIWDPEHGQCKATLSAHTGAITCFQHDGQKVISGSDRTLKMWNVRTGECVKDLLTDLSGVWQVKFNERRCVAAVQRNNMTYIEVLDFGASRDGVPIDQRGTRIVVDEEGNEMSEDGIADLDATGED
ncbi:MAG: hypothetical protein Q9227_008548 [Pyrenula ochraceoflavens]